MSTILLEAQVRTEKGKGASRRLRRLENKVPAIIYGGAKEPLPIFVLHHKLTKALETESIYSSVFGISVNSKVEQVILKSLQRHPYKSIILHMDLQRVSDQDVLIKSVPLHFINEEESKGVKAGGMISHAVSQIEIRCMAKNLPEFIEVDMTHVGLNKIVHLSDIKLPKGVELATDLKDESHNVPVASIHVAKINIVEEAVVETVSGVSTEDLAASEEKKD